MVRLLVSDIDGTLVTKDKHLTQAAHDAADRLAKAGIALALTSSRPPHGIGAIGISRSSAGHSMANARRRPIRNWKIDR